MAKTKEVSFHIGRKISDGDFGSFDIHIGEVATLEPGESFEDAMDEVRERVQGEYSREVKSIRKMRHKLRLAKQRRDDDE